MKRKLKYQTGGLSSYNPYAADKDSAFQKWYTSNTLEGKNNIPFSASLDYDYYSYYRNGDYKNYKGGHFPDTYKKPNHPTFSDESIYSVPGNTGGHWMGNKFIPPMQTGGKAPIYTKDPNDSGLKSYQDSLDSYKMSVRMYFEALHKAKFNRTDPFEGSEFSQLTKGYSFKGIKPVGINIFDDKDDSDDGVHDFTPSYKKPAQPIIYQDQPIQAKQNPPIPPRNLQLDHQNIPLPKPNLSQSGSPQAEYRSLPQPNYNNPTNFSLTYPIPGNNNQKTMYFPDRETWKRYNEAVKGVFSQEGSDYGTSTGYLKQGGMKKLDQYYYELNGKKIPSLMVNLYKKGGIKAYQMAGVIPPTTDSWYQDHPEMANYHPMNQVPDPSVQYKRQFNPILPNAAGLGIMGAYLGTKALMNQSNSRNYQAYKNRWIRDYNIPSLIQDPDKFSSTEYESPIYQQGGTAKPTMADSLALYSNASAVLNYYKKNPSYNFTAPTFYGSSLDDAHKQNDDAYDQTLSDPSYKHNTPSGMRTIKPYEYRFNVDKNKYYQRELASAQLDLRAPYQLFDRRIAPNGLALAENNNPNDQMHGDQVSFYSYDPIAIKPYSMLTSEEKKIRDQRYPQNGTENIGLQRTQTRTPQPPTKNQVISRIPNAQLPGLTKQLPGQLQANIPYSPGASQGQNTPTNFSFTYPIEGNNNHQSLYFPDRESWQQFNQSHGRGVSSQQGENYGTSTGYLKEGGLSRGQDYGSSKKPYPSVKSGSFAGGGRSYPIPTKADAVDALRLAHLHGRSDVIAKVYAKYPGLKKKQAGGMTMNTPQDQAQGYFAYPNASSLHFPGSGQRTFIPGPFPLMVKDQRGTQIMTNKPVKTYGKVTETPIYEQGGQVQYAKKVKKDDATIEAEKGELIFGAGAPGSVDDQEDRVGVGLYRIGGKSHADGGTPLKAFPGDFVFSKDGSLAVSQDAAKLLVGKEIKKQKDRTPAKLANRYMDLNKFIATAQDEDADPITKKTAILNINNYVDRLAEIAYAQEEQKGFPEGMPDFVKASLDSRFNKDELQDDVSQFKMGGQVKKYQRAGIVSDSLWDNAPNVRRPSKNAQLMDTRGWNSLYQIPGQPGTGSVPQAIPGGSAGIGWEQFIINSLQNGVSIDELVNKKHGTREGLQKYSQYYKPAGNSYEQTAAPFNTPHEFDYPNLDNVTPNIPYNPAKFNLGSNPQTPQGSGISPFTQGVNSRFNINTAEAVGLLAAGLPSQSRYPPAFRNYEIQNAKALVANTGRPISEQPYLNAISRSNLGYDQNNNAYGAAGATRGLGAYQKTLEAQNSAISQVYNQNIARQDQRNNQLAQLEVQDGMDRINNAEKYDNKLETLANNKEQEARNRASNVVNMTNQMVRDRQSLGLFNQMSDFYQIDPNYGFSLKPTYQIKDGKLVPSQRSVGQMIQGMPSSTTIYNPSIQLAEQLERMGYDKDQISRVLAKTLDDYDKQRR